MKTLWIPMAICAALVVAPQLVGRSAANDPLFGTGDDRFVLRCIRVGALGTLIVLSAILFVNSKS